MAHADNSIITGKFKGSLGKELVFREWEGKTIVAKSPKARSGDPTLAQEEIQEKFLLASRYAKAVIKSADQSLAEAYASALRPRQNVYSRALEDFMSPPVVKLIDTRRSPNIAVFNVLGERSFGTDISWPQVANLSCADPADVQELEALPACIGLLRSDMVIDVQGNLVHMD